MIPLDWDRDGADWPLREHSRFVEVGDLTWHVQDLGSGPILLLLHGTGASTHSFRALAPLLVEAGYRVIMPDLPGHGFTRGNRRHHMTLTGMARAVSELVGAMKVEPQAGIGHSAGAAILVWCRLERLLPLEAIIGLNAALLPFKGATGLVFPALAKLLFVNPLAPRLFASQANRAAVERLVGQTGSDLDEVGIGLYQRLMRNPAHVSAALGMMAGWRLEPLVDLIARLDCKLTLVVGEDDGAVPPEDAERIRARLPGTEIVLLEDLGHLAHEEDPGRVVAPVLQALSDALPNGGT